MFLNADGNLLKIEAALCWNVPVSFGTKSNGASDDLKLYVCTLRSSNYAVHPFYLKNDDDVDDKDESDDDAVVT